MPATLRAEWMRMARLHPDPDGMVRRPRNLHTMVRAMGRGPARVALGVIDTALQSGFVGGRMHSLREADGMMGSLTGEGLDDDGRSDFLIRLIMGERWDDGCFAIHGFPEEEDYRGPLMFRDRSFEWTSVMLESFLGALPRSYGHDYEKEMNTYRREEVLNLAVHHLTDPIEWDMNPESPDEFGRNLARSWLDVLSRGDLEDVIYMTPMRSLGLRDRWMDAVAAGRIPYCMSSDTCMRFIADRLSSFFDYSSFGGIRRIIEAITSDEPRDYGGLTDALAHMQPIQIGADPSSSDEDRAMLAIQCMLPLFHETDTPSRMASAFDVLDVVVMALAGNHESAANRDGMTTLRINGEDIALAAQGDCIDLDLERDGDATLITVSGASIVLNGIDVIPPSGLLHVADALGRDIPKDMISEDPMLFGTAADRKSVIRI